MNFQMYNLTTSTTSDKYESVETLERNVLQYITCMYVIVRFNDGQAIGPARRAQDAGTLVRKQFSEYT